MIMLRPKKCYNLFPILSPEAQLGAHIAQFMFYLFVLQQLNSFQILFFTGACDLCSAFYWFAKLVFHKQNSFKGTVFIGTGTKENKDF